MSIPSVSARSRLQRGIAWLAYAYARRAGIELAPLLKKAGLTDPQIKDRSARLVVHHQIQFLNLAANALRDDSLGFHLAQQLPDLRELGLLFYVAASSETLGDALQRTARYSSIVNEGSSVSREKRFGWCSSMLVLPAT